MPEDPRARSDDDTLHALSLLGMDAVGSFIVGDAAARVWLERRASLVQPWADDQVAAA